MSLASKLAMAAIASVAALTMVPEDAQAGTVISSSGPSASQFPVGTQIGDTQRITLREGDVLTVLDAGRTRVLRGPGNVILAESGGAGAENRVLRGLTSRRPQARIASSRGTPGANAQTNPNLWYVDVATPGTICLSNVDRVNLWRADKTAEAHYTIAPAGAPDASVGITFAAGEGLARWDSALQLRDGATYIIQSPDEEGVLITFNFLEDVPDDAEALAMALISNDCTVQLGQMVQAAEVVGN